MVLSFGLSNKVTSYTFAKVENSMAIIISPSEHSLIAIPYGVGLNVSKTITKIITLTDEDPTGMTNTQISVNAKLESHNFYISNNMHDTIDVSVYLDGSFIKVKNQHITILPGQTCEVPFRINDSIQSDYIEAIVYATWSNGYGEIMSEINVNVESSDEEEIIDLRTPEVPVLNIDDMQQELKSDALNTIIDSTTEDDREKNKKILDNEASLDKKAANNNLDGTEEIFITSCNNSLTDSIDNEELSREETGGAGFEDN